MPIKDPIKRKDYEKKRRQTPKYKERMKEYMKLNHRKYNKYGYECSLELYNNLFVIQNGCCALCGKHQKDLKKNLAVDHCHTTGKIRGLLCITCNTHLGIFEINKFKFENYIIERK